jgi:PAS domain S-box-containing protein
VLAARRDELAAGIVRRHAWYSPELLEEQARNPERARTADGGATQEAGTREVIGSVTLEWRTESANIDREALEPLVVVGDALVSTLARVRAERAVRSSEERFRSLAEHSSDFMCVYGETGEIMYLSPSTARFSGFGVGASFATPGIVHPDDIGLVAEVFGPLRAGPCGATSQPFEVRIRDAEGEYRWLEMIATNLLDDPVVGGIVVNARDTTERRQARDELQRINESLERTNTQLSELVDEKLEVERQLRSSEELFRAIVQNSSARCLPTRTAPSATGARSATRCSGIPRASHSGWTRSSSCTPTTRPWSRRSWPRHSPSPASTARFACGCATRTARGSTWRPWATTCSTTRRSTASSSPDAT